MGVVHGGENLQEGGEDLQGKFLFVFEEDLKNELIKAGLQPLYKHSSGAWIFVNSDEVRKKITYSNCSKSGFVTSDKMVFS